MGARAIVAHMTDREVKADTVEAAGVLAPYDDRS
jgi:hypothetical protein